MKNLNRILNDLEFLLLNEGYNYHSIIMMTLEDAQRELKNCNLQNVIKPKGTVCEHKHTVKVFRGKQVWLKCLNFDEFTEQTDL